MKKSLVNILIHPNAFFQDASAEKESLKIPGLIVLILGIISAVSAYLIGSLTAEMMAGIIPGMESIIAISTVLGAFVGIFLFWVIWTGVFYLISSFFKGQGTFKRSLEFVGYGYLPQIFGVILNVIVALQYIPRIIVPQISSSAAQDPQAIIDATNALMHDPAMREMIQVASLISIVFLLWSANIWIAGMKSARQLSDRDAALCVGIPVVAYILYIIFTMTGI
ncbi:MAG: YIP1 family protein [Methanoregula sp.]|jgi:hypothetical protein|nr:YIP1 family protein [Methanoregula sp.]